MPDQGPARDSSQGLLIASGMFVRLVPGSPADLYVGAERLILKPRGDALEPFGETFERFGGLRVLARRRG